MGEAPLRTLSDLFDRCSRRLATLWVRRGNVWVITLAGFACLTSSATADQLEHDALNRLTRVLKDDGSRLEYAYDSAGNPVSIRRVAGTSATLIHHYNFNAAAVTDLVGGVHGELLGGALVANGRLVLDGGAAYVQFPQHLVPNTGSYSVAITVIRDSLQPGVYTEFFSQGQTGGTGMYLGTMDQLIRAGDQWQDTGVAAPAVGQLTHYALTVDAANGASRLFQDGVEVASRPFAIDNGPLAGTPTRLGRQFDPFFEYFHGQLDEFRVYTGALSADDVRRLAQERTQ